MISEKAKLVSGLGETRSEEEEEDETVSLWVCDSSI